MERLNRKKALDLLGQDFPLYTRIAGYFVKDYGDYPDRIGEYISREDRQAYVVTHSLKNIAASLGADELSRLALELERILKGEDYSRAGGPLSRLLEEFRPVLEEVRLLNGEGEGERESPPADGGPEGSFGDLLDLLAEGMGSFSPDRAREALKSLSRARRLVPREFEGEIARVEELAGEFRYLEAEEILLSLRDRLG